MGEENNYTANAFLTINLHWRRIVVLQTNVDVGQPIIPLLNYVLSLLEAGIHRRISKDQVCSSKLTVHMNVDLELKQPVKLGNSNEIKILLNGMRNYKKGNTCIRIKIMKTNNNK